MKKLYVISVIALMFSVHAGSSMESVDEFLSQLQTDLSATNLNVNVELAKIETLWPNEPVAYFSCMQLAVKAASKHRPVSDIPSVQSNLFSSLIAKQIPRKSSLVAASCYNFKVKAIFSLMDPPGIFKDTQNLTEIAGFLGEIRENVIPDYQNQGAKMPGSEILIKAGVFKAGDLKDPALSKAYEKVVEKNRRDIEMNKLQSELFQADSMMTFLLINKVMVLPPAFPERDEFLQNCSKLGRLTGDEQKKIGYTSGK